VIDLPPLLDLEDALWTALMDISSLHPEGWTLVGGQMVLLHALEAGALPPRASRDLDLVVDARLRPPQVPRMAEVFDELGFALTDVSPGGEAHRFTRGPVSIDLLATEGAGARANLGVGSGASTISVEGGTFALSRTELVEVSSGGRSGCVPRPDVAGALLIKARAAKLDRRRGPERHLRDLAFLLSLVAAPLEVRDALGKKNRHHLAALVSLHDPDHEAWGLLDPQPRADAISAHGIITGHRLP